LVYRAPGIAHCGRILTSRAELLIRDVGARIAELRRLRGWTQADLAARVGVSDKYLQRVEAGAENLTLRTLVGFADALGVEVPSMFRLPQALPRRRGRPSVGAREPGALDAPVRILAGNVHQTVAPLLTLSARAGAPDIYTDAGVADWVALPGRRSAANLFIVRVLGDSMSPRVESGALAVFRAGPAASRDDALALVALEPDEHGARYVFKRLRFLPTADVDVQPVRLESLNPQGPSWEVYLRDGGDVRVVAEFVERLGPP
jgi:transcriptional regulator with XRE-family HTH domain